MTLKEAKHLQEYIASDSGKLGVMDLMQQQLAAATETAIDELHHQTIDDVQRATAVVWAGRAAAAYHLYSQSGDLKMLLDASEYHHEALEHAALVSTDSNVLNAVRHYLTVVKMNATGEA